MLTAFVPLMLLPLPLALLACGGAALFAPAAARLAGLVLAGYGALLTAFFLLGGAVGGAVQLPVGLPGIGFGLGLDPLSGFFLLPVMLCGLAAFLSGSGRPAPDAGALPVLLAGLTLLLMAADGFVLLLGLSVTALGGWGLALPETGAAERAPALMRQLGAFVAGFACLVAVLGLLAPLQGGMPDLRFAAMHASVLVGWRSVIVLLLVLVAGAALTGLWPFQDWLPEATGNARGAGAALLGMAPVAGLYVLVRLLFDLSGPMLPAWWGWPLVALGAGSALRAMLRANLAAELRPLVAAGGIGHLGLAVIGTGIALVARAADLPPLAALALGAALLHGFATALIQGLLLLASVAAEQGAGTRRLDRLGGLIRGMPGTTIAVLLGGFGFAFLPAGAGFAGMWLLVQALLGALRIGGMGGQLLLALAMGAIGLTAGLAVSAMIRLIGIAFLGRPRSPRGAAAEEAPGRMRAALGLIAVCMVLTGLLPGPVLGLAGPALHILLGTEESRSGALLLVPLAGAPPYSALAVAGVVVLATLLALWAAGRWTQSGGRTGPAWDGGFAAPPAWLPFGDPLTELGPVGLSATLGRLLGRAPELANPLPASWRGGLERLPARLDAFPASIFAILAVLAALLVVLWMVGA